MNLTLKQALRYSTTEIKGLLPKLAEGGAEAQAGHNHRLVAADAFQEADRHKEADLLRSEFPLYVHQGKVYTAQIDPEHLEDFKDGYKSAALFSSSLNDRGDSPDTLNLGEASIDPETLKEMESDATHFYHSYGHLIPSNALADAGRDFWLSRNGHGTGFFDADYFTHPMEDHSQTLQEAARKAGEYYLHLDEDDENYPLKGFGGSHQWGQPEGLQQEQQ